MLDLEKVLYSLRSSMFLLHGSLKKVQAILVAIALTLSERSIATTFVFSGAFTGGVISFISMPLLLKLGWRSAFYINGGTCLFYLIATWFTVSSNPRIAISHFLPFCRVNAAELKLFVQKEETK